MLTCRTITKTRTTRMKRYEVRRAPKIKLRTRQQEINYTLLDKEKLGVCSKILWITITDSLEYAANSYWVHILKCVNCKVPSKLKFLHCQLHHKGKSIYNSGRRLGV